MNAEEAENEETKDEITASESTDTLDDRNDETLVVCTAEKPILKI